MFQLEAKWFSLCSGVPACVPQSAPSTRCHFYSTFHRRNVFMFFCWVVFILNKPGTVQVGAPPKAQKEQKYAKASRYLFKKNLNLTVPKTPKRIPFYFKCFFFLVRKTKKVKAFSFLLLPETSKNQINNPLPIKNSPTSNESKKPINIDRRCGNKSSVTAAIVICCRRWKNFFISFFHKISFFS